MRASDADRDRAADVLKAALAEGRLSYEEHHERLDQILSARTHGELVHLTADLPHGNHHPAAMPATQPVPWQGAPYRRPTETEPLAIASLVLSLLFFITAITSIPAVITGHLALARIKRNKTEGHGMAVAGLVIGYIGIALGILIVLVVLGMLVAFNGGDVGPPMPGPPGGGGPG